MVLMSRNHKVFEPALGMESPQRQVPCALWAARRMQPLDQAGKCGGRALLEDPLFRTDPKDDLLAAAKRSRFVGHPGAGKFQAAPAKRYCRGREHGDFTFRQQAEHVVNRSGETLEHGGLIRAAH